MIVKDEDIPAIAEKAFARLEELFPEVVEYFREAKKEKIACLCGSKLTLYNGYGRCVDCDGISMRVK